MFRSASLFIGTSFTVAVFIIFATLNVDSIVGIPQKTYSMKRILINIKTDPFVKCAHLHPRYAANLVARSQYYHCHWTILSLHNDIPLSALSHVTQHISHENDVCKLSNDFGPRMLWMASLISKSLPKPSQCLAFRSISVVIIGYDWWLSFSSS